MTSAQRDSGIVPGGPLPLCDCATFDAELAQGAEPLALFRDALRNGAAALLQRFHSGAAAAELVHGRAGLIDLIVVRAWRRFLDDGLTDIALIAVGGYGRGELHPGSDIDLMVLLEGAAHQRYRERMEQFLTFLWDIGLEVGHSVRSLEECVREATGDVTVATNLMESRLLAGPHVLFEAMRAATGPERIWPTREFFEAKFREQRARHHKYHDTGYNLEPNVKESPGGLRDIQMIGWVAKRHFGAETLHDLVGHGFLTEAEYAALMEGQKLLWRIRFALHMLAGRREDRLLFDHQRALAQALGYHDHGHHLAVEQFMQRYYRTVMELSRLNEMLLQLFQEAILYADDPGVPQPLNKRFQVRKGFLEVSRADVFRHYPFALLEVFLLLQQHPELKGVRASTIRQIRDHRHLIDDKFRDDLRARALFMEILRQPQGLSHELWRMHRYGVLAAYVPTFGHVVGRMQYDLFHVYTVDEHTLFLVRNLRRFTVPECAHEFPLCSDIMQRLPKPELLYLAGLFHDIAKGRGGDHSELGAQDAEHFCLHHGLSRYDARLVTWLVRNHLIMSMTAQRRDISDPEVIKEFAHRVGDQSHLNYLYLLTVADIRATNPNLWNSWKDALLLELYTMTKRALRRGLEKGVDVEEHIQQIQSQARALLLQMGLDEARIQTVWSDFSEDYFLRYSGDEIAWHTHSIAGSTPADLPLVLVRQETRRGSTEVFIHTRDHHHLFALTASALNQLGLTIVDARLTTSNSGLTLDTYLVLEDTGEPISNPYRVQEILATLKQELARTEQRPPPVSRRIPRQLRHFHTTTEVSFSDDTRNNRTVVELITADRPGLLSRVAQAFLDADVRVQNAKIATIGARAEDVFFITDRDNQPLHDEAQCTRLRNMLIRYLDEPHPATSKA